MDDTDLSVHEPLRLPDPIVTIFREWAMIKQRIDQMTKQRNTLRDTMAEAVESRGYTDHKGSQLLDLPFPLEVGDVTYTRIKRERRVSVVADPDEAEALTLNAGIHDGVGEAYYERAFPLVRVLDVEVLYQLLQEGVLDEEDMDLIFRETESFAFKGLTS